ncbi:hypothetical protein ACL02U_06355 [Streptomyces sp. MS06]|uniref:hypothetical protein n=1 Tax=Streptomyces sp. MS06 TaxID=3385974 RepID=UPI0039A32E86
MPHTPQRARTPVRATPAEVGRGHRGRTALAHGLLNGTGAFAFLLITLGALPLGTGTAMLVMFGTLVLSPALASYRAQPRPPAGRSGGAAGEAGGAGEAAGERDGKEPRGRGQGRGRGWRGRRSEGGEAEDEGRAWAQPRDSRRAPEVLDADGGERAEQEVTRFGELLGGLPLPSGAALTEWQTALDAYERAKGAAAEDVPRILEEGRAALARIPGAPAREAWAEWSRGCGTATVRLAKPSGRPGSRPSGNQILLFAAESEGGFRVQGRTGGRGRLRTLAEGRRGPALVRVPLPVSTERDVTVEISCDGPWRAALRSASEARRLSGTLRGSAGEVLLNEAGHRGAVFEHLGEGPFTVREPSARDPYSGRVVAEGEGRCRLHLGLHGVRVLFVETEVDWMLTAD